MTFPGMWCRDCGRELSDGEQVPRYANSGPLKCEPCDDAAWKRLDALNADRPAQPGNTTTNVWD